MDASMGKMKRIIRCLDITEDDTTAVAGTSTGTTENYDDHYYHFPIPASQLILPDQFEFALFSSLSTLGEMLRFLVRRDPIKDPNEADKLVPLFQGYSREKFGMGVKSVLALTTTVTLVGAGDGTLAYINHALNTVSGGSASDVVQWLRWLSHGAVGMWGLKLAGWLVAP